MRDRATVVIVEMNVAVTEAVICDVVGLVDEEDESVYKRRRFEY